MGNQSERRCMTRPDDTETRPVESRDGGCPNRSDNRDDGSVNQAER